MDSSLTHNTPKTPTSLHDTSLAADEDMTDGGDDPTAGDRDFMENDAARESDQDARIKRGFHFSEFIALANRVVDEGDKTAMNALRDLQVRCGYKFGDGDDHTSTGWRSIASQQLTPFHPLPPSTRIIRRIPQFPTPEQERTILSSMTAAPARVGNQDSVPPRVSAPLLEPCPRGLISSPITDTPNINPPPDVPPLTGNIDTAVMPPRRFKY
ncbi:UNVERIFIED_CONTAM: hypothetical protein Slati_0160300 [Sesamum latifolium]|uniref:Uncharacterized protein n=1 Tax=Sesamum latifolium TaxID=2727402 RepID=A0AAW2YBB3_9LAMI